VAELAGEPDRAAVGLDDPASEREAEAYPAGGAGAALVGAKERARGGASCAAISARPAGAWR